jgi:hypothetical protein
MSQPGLPASPADRVHPAVIPAGRARSTHQGTAMSALTLPLASPGTLDEPTIEWLLAGDPAIRWQVLRDLRGSPPAVWKKQRREVARAGWGKGLLDHQRPDGNWGDGPYLPKWTCTTYTMQLLWQLGLEPGHPAALGACRAYLDSGVEEDGGINFWRPRRRVSETCISGMIFGQLCYFGGAEDAIIDRMADYLLGEQMADGGWNCRRSGGAAHSSFHTTISVLEGLREYVASRGLCARGAAQAAARGREFLLAHRLFRSHQTGEVVANELTHFHFPTHWHFDVLRGLDYFRSCAAPRDERLQDGIDLLLARQQGDGRWALARSYPGAMHLPLEAPGEPSRWNTLRALRVLRWWQERH